MKTIEKNEFFLCQESNIKAKIFLNIRNLEKQFNCEMLWVGVGDGGDDHHVAESSLLNQTGGVEGLLRQEGEEEREVCHGHEMSL